MPRVAHAKPTILVAGVVPHLEGLEVLGQIQRAGWSVAVRCAARADLVVVGWASAGVDAAAVIAGLKDHPPSVGVPVLHAPPAGAPCAECRADVCLSSGSTPGQLARAASVLLEPGRRGRGARAGARLEPRSQHVRPLSAHL